MYVENGGKSIKGLGQMQGPPLEFLKGGGGVDKYILIVCICPLILRGFFKNCLHLLLCTGYFYMGGGGRVDSL